MAATERRYRGRSPEERSAERRARLMEAGLQLYGTVGYSGTSVERICTSARLSTRQFYEEFGNRDELLVALYDDVNERAGTAVLEAFAEELEDDGDVRQLTRRVLNAYVAQTAADPRWAQIAYVTIVGVNPRIERHREARRAAWARLICAQLDDLARRGRIPPQDPRLTVRAFIGAVNELVQTWCRMSPRPPLQEVTETLVHLLHSALTTPRPG